MKSTNRRPRGDGGSGRCFQVERMCSEMVKKVVAKFGGIDILVNNAALTDHANIFDSTEEEFDKVIAVSFKGPYLVTKYVAEQMKQTRARRQRS